MNAPTFALLLLRWADAFRTGQDLTPAELLPDRPDLHPRLQQAIDLLRDETDTLPRSPVLPIPEATPDAASGADPDPTAPQSGMDRIDPPPGYALERELGRGGMGVVYLARQTRLDRPCALKMILTGERAAAAERQRFVTEAQAIARLQHENIVRVYEIGEHHGQLFMALELCEGGSLDGKLRAQRPSPREAAALVQTLALAMQAAHEAQVLHRDLKPANVLLAADGTPKITDFGLARKLDEQGQTQTGQIMGTPSYMAPEQARGQKDLGPAVDVWALGAILYECLTGRPPFKGATPTETLRLVVETEPVAVRHLSPAVPLNLETICHKCLQKDPARRYGSAQELADDLGRFLRGEPILARPTGRLERWWCWCRRRPGVVGLSVLAALLLGILTVLLTARGPADLSWQDVKASGKLRVATDPTYPPLEYEVDGKMKGYDIDFAEQIGEGLGLKIEFESVNWDWPTIVQRLNAHDFDVVISGVQVFSDREKDVAFLDYLNPSHYFVCRRGSIFKEAVDLVGKTVAVAKGTGTERLVNELIKSGVKIKKVLPERGNRAPFDLVREGKADVTLAHEPAARWFAREKNPPLAVMGPLNHPQAPDKIGIAFRSGDRELKARVAEVVEKMRTTVQKELQKKWLSAP
jgi:ABC-type amino acid transport substrate-binding protein